jgi:DNA-directed RNA polymerase subunit RPC12/RpoP
MELQKLIDGLKAHKYGAASYESVDEAIQVLSQLIGEKPTCERCGKKIAHINTSVFNYDGSDSDVSLPVQYDPTSGCISFTTSQNWTSYELTDEERKDDIRCPYCGKYPFDMKCEIELYESVEVLMWATKPKNSAVFQEVECDGTV